MITINDKRTLLIASDISSYSRNEVQSVINNLKPQVIIGEQATLDNFLENVLNGDFDRLWFISHCDLHGIALYDSHMAHDILVPLIRNRISEIFFNTCASSDVAHLINNHVPNVAIIATLADISDEKGYEIGNSISKQLKEGNTFLEAYQSLGVSEEYIYIPASNEGSNLDDVERLITIIDGDESLGVTGLVNSSHENGKKIDRQTKWMIGLSVIQIMMLILVMYMVLV